MENKVRDIKVVSVSKVAKDLEKLFEIEKTKSIRNGNKFFIDKNSFVRPVVINMLKEYFEDKRIINGRLVVRPITLIFTMFEIIEQKEIPYPQMKNEETKIH